MITACQARSRQSPAKAIKSQLVADMLADIENRILKATILGADTMNISGGLYAGGRVHELTKEDELQICDFLKELGYTIQIQDNGQIHMTWCLTAAGNY